MQKKGKKVLTREGRWVIITKLSERAEERKRGEKALKEFRKKELDKRAAK